jgi:hypothetical protein
MKFANVHIRVAVVRRSASKCRSASERDLTFPCGVLLLKLGRLQQNYTVSATQRVYEQNISGLIVLANQKFFFSLYCYFFYKGVKLGDLQ